MKTLILGAGYAGLATATKMKPTPDLYDRLRADAVRAAQSAPRRGNNPWTAPEQYPRPAYRDPTGETATARADKTRKTPRR